MISSAKKRWCAVYSKPQKEDLAQWHLRSKGLEVFLPKLVLPDCAKRPRRIVPLFPNYLFVRIDITSEQAAYVVWAPGVKRLVSFAGVPATVDDNVMEFLMERSDASGHIAAASNLKAGQQVRITGGPFSGLTGLIQEPPDARGRVKVLMTLLNREVKAEVPLRLVECGWVV